MSPCSQSAFLLFCKLIYKVIPDNLQSNSSVSHREWYLDWNNKFKSMKWHSLKTKHWEINTWHYRKGLWTAMPHVGAHLWTSCSARLVRTDTQTVHKTAAEFRLPNIGEKDTSMKRGPTSWYLCLVSKLLCYLMQTMEKLGRCAYEHKKQGCLRSYRE